MFEKKRGTRFLASVMALVMLLSLAPVGALAAKEDKGSPEDAASSAMFQAVTITTNLTGESKNGFTKAYAMWKGKNTDGTEDGKYYLAIASVEQQQKIDKDFQDKINEKFENPASYIHNNGTLSVQCGNEGFENKTPGSVTGKDSNTWVILVMTPKELKEKLHYNNSNGTFNLGISARGFDINITIEDEEFKGTVDGDVNPPESSEPSTQYERLYVTILNGTEFPNEPGFSHKHDYDFVKRNDDGEYSVESYNTASYNSSQQVFSTQAGNFIKVNAFNAAGLTTNGNVKGLYNANGIDLTEYTTFTESDANAIAAAYASYKNLETGATYKLVPYVLKYEDHGQGPDFPSTGYHLDCIVVKNQTVLVKYDVNGAITDFQLPDNTYVVPGSDVTIGSWKNSSGTVANNITAKKDGKDVTFVGWSTDPDESPNGEGLYQAGSELQNVTGKTTLYAIWKEKKDTTPTDPPLASPTLETAKFFINLGGKDASKPDGSGLFTRPAIVINEAINLDVFTTHATRGYGNNGYIFNKDGVKNCILTY